VHYNIAFFVWDFKICRALALTVDLGAKAFKSTSQGL